MGAKVMIIGPAKAVQFHKKKNRWLFRIVAKPAYGNPPKGMKMFGETVYHIECTNRQWRRGHASEDDDSDLIIEGYQVPRQEGGKLYIAVTAMSVATKRLQSERKLKQIEEAMNKAVDAFRQGKQEELPPEQLRVLAEQVVKAQESVNKFLSKHPELLPPLKEAVAEEPAAEEPAAESVVAKTAAKEVSPVAETPPAEVPVTEMPAVEGEAAEVPTGTETPIAEAPSAKAPVAETPANEGTAAEVPTGTETPIAEAPSAKVPVAETSANEGTAAEVPAEVETPAVEEVTVES